MEIFTRIGNGYAIMGVYESVIQEIFACNTGGSGSVFWRDALGW